MEEGGVGGLLRFLAGPARRARLCMGGGKAATGAASSVPAAIRGVLPSRAGTREGRREGIAWGGGVRSIGGVGGGDP